MTDTLATFAQQVTTVAREVGVDGRLGRQANVLGAAGTWKDPTGKVHVSDLENPLAPIHNALKLQRMPGADPSLLSWSRDVIERQIRQLTRLVEDLLDISRITRGKIQLRVERLDLAAVIEGAVETSRPLIDGRKHALAVRLPEERIELSGDLVRLTQAVANLLDNAAKFQDEGGQITVSAEREGKEAVIRVRDRGIGLEPGSREKIFDLFAQVRSRTASTRASASGSRWCARWWSSTAAA
jgi:signal transduction histidine kinase